MTLEGIKHIIECHCTLPQYRNSINPVYHKFVVFSILKNDIVVPKHAQCNNCGVIHYVVDIMKSQPSLSDEHSDSVTTIDDIKMQLPPKILTALENYQVDLPTYEEISFLYENEKWGSKIIIARKEFEGIVTGKTLMILGPDKVKIETFRFDPFLK